MLTVTPRGKTEELPTDPLARFGLIASAIGGRPLVVTGIDGPGWTDGRTLFIDRSTEPRRQVILMSALVGAGSLEREILRELTGWSKLTRRYLAIEGRRALRTLAGRLPAAVVPDAGRLPGSADQLDSATASLELARSKIRIPDAPGWFGALRPRRVNLDAEQEAVGSTVTLQLDDISEDDEGDEEENSEGTSKDDGRRDHKPRASPFANNPLSRAFQAIFGASFSSGSAEDGAELRMSKTRMGSGQRGLIVTTAVPVPVPVRTLSGPSGTVYPEWDCHREGYRPEWCTVVEWLPGPQELAPLDRPARHHGLRRELGRLGLGPARTRGQRDGYDLDLDAAVDAQTILATGRTPPDNVYVDNRRISRELGVLVLLDASGSGDERTAEGETVFELQRTVTAALVDTLAELGDRVASYAFRSQGRRIDFTRLKGFDERFGSTTLHRIGGVKPSGFTRFGGAIRHATHLLREEGGTHRRLLVVISDGFPYDHGYEGTYAEGDARMALDEARANGVGCLCLNLGSSTAPEALARIYTRTEHATAPDLDTLTPSMLALFYGALRTADLRRKYGADRAAQLSA